MMIAMSPTLTTPQNLAEHHLEWNDRLQDWLDGDVEATDGDAFESHLRDCTLCQQRLEEFSKLETALFAANPAPSLSASFDSRLFEQIDAVSEDQRAAARQRVEQELQDNLRALSRSWRRTWAFVIPGMIGGIVLAFALIGYADALGLTGKLAVEGATELGGNAGTLQVILTGLMGAGIGGFMSGWLAKGVE
jgi:anti-sigma factor RsiW